jgi:DNA mismatch repair protein MutH
MNHHAPTSLDDLTHRIRAVEGLTLGDLAHHLGITLPEQLTTHKGLAGQLLEKVLGADAGNESRPDFSQLGIELKTIPVNAQRRPRESTYVCTVPLQAPYPSFEQSVVHAKLSHVLWVPLMTDAPRVSDWRILKAVFWQPNDTQFAQLRHDFNELIDMIALGQLDQITSRWGDALHIRPKAANAKQLTHYVGQTGAPEQTLPRGFYLRTGFTTPLISD